MIQPGTLAFWSGDTYLYRGLRVEKFTGEHLEFCAGCEVLLIGHAHVWQPPGEAHAHFYYCKECHRIVGKNIVRPHSSLEVSKKT